MSDDFEFKPLTEGLGFHKKVIELKDDLQANLDKPLDFMDKPLDTVAMPRPMMKPQPQQTPVQTPVNRPLPGRTQKPQWTESLPKHEFREQAAKAPQPPLRLIPVAVAWPGAIFDCTMILGLALIFSAAVFTITKIDLSQLIEMLREDGAAQWASLFIIFCVFEIYTVACRSFFGKTLGEWVFDYRLGTPEEQVWVSYPIRVAIRSLLISITGFVLFPILNTIFGEDLLGKLTGVSLFMEKR